MTPPGACLLRLARRICSDHTVRRLIEPIVADLQFEFEEALPRGAWVRRRVLWSGYLGFWKALVLHCMLDTFTLRGRDGTTRRALMFSLLAFTLMTMTTVLPPLLSFHWTGSPVGRALLALCLVPQALPLSLPSAVCVGIIAGMRGAPLTGRRLVVALGMGFAAAAVAWVAIEWLVPASNMLFRELVAAELSNGQPVYLEPGLNELGLSRLGQRTDLPAVRHFHLIWALIAAAVPLAVVALGISARVRRLPVALVAGLAASLAYVSLMLTFDNVRPETIVAIVATAWLPNLLFGLAGVALLRLNRPLAR